MGKEEAGQLTSRTLLTQEDIVRPELGYESLTPIYIFQNDFRLDASFYSTKAFVSRKILRERAYALTPLSQLFGEENIFTPPPLKRYFTDKDKGTPYLMPSELFLFKPSPNKYVLKNKIPNVQRWYIRKGWLLITQSGLPGLPLIATKDLESYVISQNLIRMIPSQNQLTGYIYAFLSSWIGQSLVTKDQYGITVEHIVPKQIAKVTIPQLPEGTQKRIHVNIMKTYELRERGREYLVQAEELLLHQLSYKLPPHDQTFSVGRSDLNWRLDASYHLPIGKKIVEILKSHYSAMRLSDKAKVVVAPRFKRIYVGKDVGIPFIQGAHVPMVKPIGLQYISKLTKGLSNWIVKEGWVLMSCSGTIGKVALIPKAWNGWATSQHALRIIPHDDLDAGYLASFLTSYWGSLQVQSKIYGGVVDEIDEEGMNEIYIPIIDGDKQKEIGVKTREAFELRERANFIEDATIRTLEEFLSSPSSKDKIESYNETFELIGNEELEVLTGLEEERNDNLRSWEGLKKETGLDAS